jgi:putative Holliday junction resolvase
MTVLPLIEAAEFLSERGALIGLDLGSKTIGVAASDPDRRVAAPVETIARKRFNLDAGRILELAAERRATGFVLGLPINMDGSEGPARSRRAPLHAIWHSSPSFPSDYGMSGCRPPPSSAR